MDQPLAGLKVVDLTWHVAGPQATKLLADYGAEVLKVERPETGDPARRYGPFPGDIPHRERSGMFLHLNTNKRGITVNLKTAAGRTIVRELAKSADVLVESFSPGVAARFGFDYESLCRLNPRLIVCSVSNYGQTGPYRDYKATEMTMYAHAGLVHSLGVPEREPLRSVDHLPEYQAGGTAAAAIVGAAIHQRWSGEGQFVDVSLFEVGSGSSDRRITRTLGYEYTGESIPRSPAGSMPGGAALPCSDGYVLFTVSPPSRWRRLFEMIGAPQLASTGTSALPGLATEEELSALLYPWCLERTKQQVMERAQAHGVPATAINSPSDILRDPYLRERGYFVEADHAEAGRLAYAGRALFIDGEAWEMRRAAPLLGEHNEEVLCGGLGFSTAEAGLLRAEGVI